MQKHKYSQLPVVESGQVLGIFSYRSFARGTASATLEEWKRQQTAPGDLPVDEFIERFEFVRLTEDVHRVIDAVGRDDGVIVGSPERLIGILTPMDFLRYLYRVAGPFVVVSEIELALRALIRRALSPNGIANAARRCLSGAYGSEAKVPVELEKMTFDNYVSLISYGTNWLELELVFGGTRSRTSGKLRAVGEIRNNLFHFRKEITQQDHDILVEHRDWLLTKINQKGPPRTVETES
jgi:hypothetical protein